VIVGTCSVEVSGGAGFVFEAGVFTAVNFTGAADTAVEAINDNGELSGTECNTTCRGFTRVNDEFTTVNFPATTGTIVNLVLNNAGQLAAQYQDLEGNFHGAVSAIGPFAYVGNGTSPSCCTLTVLDTSTNLVLTTIPIGGLGYPFGISPDQTHLYVPIGNTVDVIDTATNSLTATVSGVTPIANSVTIAPNGKFGYTGDGNISGTSGSVSVFSTMSNSVVATVPLTFGVGSVTVTPDGSHLYAGGVGSTIAVINTSTNKVESTFSIPVPAGE
jgi:YVTN family beta-propeller protein